MAPTPGPRRNLRYADVVKWCASFTFSVNTKEPSIHEIAKTFLDNLRRLWRFAKVPASFAGNAMANQLCIDMARVKIIGSIERMNEQVEIQTKEQLDKEWKRLWPVLDFPNSKPGFDAHSKRSADFIDECTQLDDEAHDGIEAFLFSLLTDSRAMFEALSEDLLLAATSIRPNRLAGLNGADWDVRVPPLRTKKKRTTAFRTLDWIRNSYSWSFADDPVAVLLPLRESSLDLLHALRNIIVHKSGVVDQLFLDRTTSSTIRSRAQIDAKIQIDGADVVPLCGCAATVGGKLIKAVDNWIASHP